MRRPPGVERTQKEAITLCRTLQGEARNGENFASLATHYSDGPRRMAGGNVGPLASGYMDHIEPIFPYTVQGVEKALLRLDVGETSEVIVSPFGCHIVQRYE